MYRFGRDGAAKVLTPSTPSHWAQVEATHTEAVRPLGVPAPAVRDVTEIDGRPAVIFDYVDGPSMWHRMVEQPDDVPALSRELASIQRAIHEAGVPDGLPSLVDRLRLKVDATGALRSGERSAAAALLDSQPVGAAVLHGDLHPGNVLLSADGPMVIDWFDATVGLPAADIARTGLLLRDGATDLRHLPGAAPGLLAKVEEHFADAVRGRVPADVLHTWHRLRAAGRLAERTDLDVSGLVAIWREVAPGPDTNRPDTDHSAVDHSAVDE